jgi:Helix-turn-helix domain
MTETTELPKLMTASEISRKIMPVHARTLKRARARGKIQGYLHLGKWRFDSASVLAWISGKGIEVAITSAPAKRRRGRPPRKEVAK